MDYIGLIISSLISLVSVYFGHYLSCKSSKRIEDKKQLVSFVSEFFTNYTIFVPNQNAENTFNLLCSIEKIKLFSNSELEKILIELQDAVTDTPIDQNLCGQKFSYAKHLIKKKLES